MDVSFSQPSNPRLELVGTPLLGCKPDTTNRILEETFQFPDFSISLKKTLILEIFWNSFIGTPDNTLWKYWDEKHLLESILGGLLGECGVLWPFDEGRLNCEYARYSYRCRLWCASMEGFWRYLDLVNLRPSELSTEQGAEPWDLGRNGGCRQAIPILPLRSNIFGIRQYFNFAAYLGHP